MELSVEILFEDAALVVASKPSGMLTEGGAERERDLEQAVSATVGKQVWCCHRLDRLTSGVVVLRKGKRFTKELAAQFEGGQVRKEYWLLVEGVWDKRIQKVESRIGPLGKGIWANVESGGKEAVSTFRVKGVNEGKGVSWVSGLLKTGRTHQMRLHAQKVGCPVLGDPLYGTVREDGFFGLHARAVRTRHPDTGEELRLEAEVPEAWRDWIGGLGE